MSPDVGFRGTQVTWSGLIIHISSQFYYRGCILLFHVLIGVVPSSNGWLEFTMYGLELVLK
jgi:hypothetical protein